MHPVAKSQAEAAMTRHVLKLNRPMMTGKAPGSPPSSGFFFVGAPDLPSDAKAMELPPNMLNMSRHYLKTPHGDEMLFTWIAGEQAWRCDRRTGNRIAHTATYLASHGWTYSRPLEP